MNLTQTQFDTIVEQAVNGAKKHDWTPEEAYRQVLKRFTVKMPRVYEIAETVEKQLVAI